MEIVGSGFLARTLAPLKPAHPDAVLLAAGVSAPSCRSDDEFQREADLLYRSIRRCLAEGRRLVYFSSAHPAMYGAPGCSGREDDLVFPTTPYGRHKLAMEAVLAASGVDYLALRVTNCVGAHHSPHQMLPGLITQLRSGTINVYRGAHRDLIAADNLVTVIDSLLERRVTRTVVNVASGFAVPSEDIITHLEERLGTDAVWRSVDAPARYHISTDRLLELVPQAAEFGFGPDYYRGVLDRYLDYYADASQAA